MADGTAGQGYAVLWCTGAGVLQEKEKEQLLMNIEKPDRFEVCLEESGRARKSRIGKALSVRVYQAFTTVGAEKDDSKEPACEDTCED